jgi:N-acetylglucosaminyldiphosphoundecaprenol N-acetyl-beta-D-mannosaminyltransferase
MDGGKGEANINGIKTPPVIDILGIPIHQVTREELLGLLRKRMESGIATWRVTANAELIVRAGDNPALAEALHRADLLVADGSGVVWAARSLGSFLPERLPGIEIGEEMIKWAAKEGLGVYFLGAEPGVAESAIDRLSDKYPDLMIVGHHHGYFSQWEEQGILERIADLKPDILLVALGAPRQELWLDRNIRQLGVPMAVGVGGSFDVWAGRVKRAPAWTGDLGLEWLYRLVTQPWRARRMLALPRFVYRVIKTKLTAR